MTQLSKRMRKEEYENEFNNKTKVEELRTKYIPTFKSFINDSIYKKTSYRLSPIKEKITFRSNNMNINKISLNKNIIIDKKIMKPNLILKSINNTEKTNDIDDKNIIVFDFTTKNNFFSELLNEDTNFTDNIKTINKKDLLKLKNDKEKIIILLDKNREIMNEIRKIEERYKKLRNEYIFLYRNINNITINNNNNFFNINHEYENYITKDNMSLKKRLENFENLFLSMTNYINDISKLFNLKQIDYIEMKNNINKSNSKLEKTITNAIEILNENIQAIKERLIFQNNLKSKTKIFEKRNINRIKYK